MSLNTTIKTICSAMLLLLLFGCKESPLRFSVQFETLNDLKANVPVYLDEMRIGQVERITSTDNGDFLVKVSIAPEHRSKATQNAKFYIGADPRNAKSSALRVVQKESGGTPLEDGTIVKGIKAPGLIDSLVSVIKKNADEAAATLQQRVDEFKLSAAAKSNELSHQLKKSLADISRQFSELDLNNRLTPSDEEIAQLKDALDVFIEEFERSSKELQDQMRTEVIPQLRRDLEALKERLETDRRNEEIRGMKDKLDGLTVI